MRSDQWWFFGPYAESQRIFSFRDAPRLLTSEFCMPVIAASLLAIHVWRTGRACWIENACLLGIGAVLFAGGALASIGGHLGGYFGALHFWGVMTTIILLARFTWMAVAVNSRRSATLAVSTLSVVAVLSACVAALSFRGLSAHAIKAKSDPARLFVPELGGYLDARYRDYVALARATDLDIIEEYWGLWSAMQRKIPPWPVDSVIHALGRKRQPAADAIRIHRGLVISTSHAASPAWQPWNLSQNYWFYRELLLNWSPSASSPSTIVWHRNDSSRTFQAVACRVDGPSRLIITRGTTEPALFETDISYRVSGNGRFLLMVRNNISVGEDANGYVSLDPSQTHARVPVYIAGASEETLDVKAIGNADPASFQLEFLSCSARRFDSIPSEFLGLAGSEETKP